MSMARALGFLLLLTPPVIRAQAPAQAPVQAPAQAPPLAPAQQVAIGTIRGIVFDSLGRKPLGRATVELASPARVVMADERGNFTLDSVPVGAHRLVFSAPDLDSIGLFGFARDLNVRAGVQQVTLATPSFSTMYRTLCAPSKEAAKDSAIMFGTVYDARTRQPVKDATVSFSWYAVETTSGPKLVELSRQSTTDDAGNYGRCGLPPDLGLRLHADAATASSGAVSTVIGNTRVFRRDLYISDEFSSEAGTIPKADSVLAARRGTGIVRGTVRDEKGGPLIGALVVLLGSDHAARTDSLGQYRFVNVPLGTQEVSVRQVGRGALFRTIDVAGDAPLDVSFTLPQATVLATMNVRGERRLGVDQAEFLARQRLGWGRYLNQQELRKRSDLPSALSRLGGLSVRQTAGGLSIANARNGCQPFFLIDGVPGPRLSHAATLPIPGQPTTPLATPMEMRIESLNVMDIVAVEYYPGLAGMPLQYAYGDAPLCGMLLIWTVFARW